MEERDDEPAERRPGDRGDLSEPVLPGRRVLERLARYDLGRKRARRWRVERVADPAQREAGVDGDERTVQQRQRRQPDRRGNEHALREQNDPFAVVMVGEMAGHQRQQHDRQQLDEPDKPERERRVGALV